MRAIVALRARRSGEIHAAPGAVRQGGGDAGLADVSRHFIAGVMEHAPAMMVFFNPTVNSYRRLNMEALVPTRVCWGHDNRFALVRVPQERGGSTRIELRLGDGTANPYLAYTSALAAGLDGITRPAWPGAKGPHRRRSDALHGRPGARRPEHAT